ncbi:MAG: hypothetical protein LUO92_02325 [Methanothrix sp.]|nr:hypothetical protein [Methanothrix sp.]
MRIPAEWLTDLEYGCSCGCILIISSPRLLRSIYYSCCNPQSIADNVLAGCIRAWI